MCILRLQRRKQLNKQHSTDVSENENHRNKSSVDIFFKKVLVALQHQHLRLQ